MYGSKQKEQSENVDKIACTNCPSSDALVVYRKVDKQGRTKHDATCFSCGHYEPNPPGYENAEVSASVSKASAFRMGQNSPAHTVSTVSPSPVTHTMTKAEQLESFLTYPTRALPDRGIRKETCDKYDVRVSLSETDGVSIVTHKYPNHKRGKLSGYKERNVADKKFFSYGDCKDTQLFGSHCHPPGGKTLFITEGELDALALYQTLKDFSTVDNWEPAVVSLTHGSSSAARDIAVDMDYVESFGKVVLVFDQDDPGQEAVEDVCPLLAGKVFIAKLSEKDANDMVLEGKSDELYWAVQKHARPYMPDNIVNYAECWDRYKEGRNQTCFPWAESWREANNMTYGVRLGELITVTAGSGVGKTQVLREMKDHFYRTTDFKIGDIALEEDMSDSMSGMMSLYLNKRISLPDVHVTEEEEREAFDFYYKPGRITGYDYFGGLSDGNLFSKIRWFAATGHKLIFLDHLSIIVSEYAAEGGERERIDTIMTKLAKMVKELGITIFLVVHLRKTDGKSFEEGYVPTLDDLRGSGTLKQLSWMVIAISRNQQHDDKFCANTSLITILKCRFTGRTGSADFLHFNDKTGRMVAVPQPTDYFVRNKSTQPQSKPKNAFSQGF